MSTIDVGITDTPQTIRSQPQPAVAARPRVAPAPVVADDGFYVGSVKIESTAQPHPAAAPAVKAWSR